MVRISDIQDNKVLWDTVPFCDIDEGSIETYLLKPNDILFARTGGTVGKSYLVKAVPEEAIYAGYLIRTRYSNSLSPEYLKFFMEIRAWDQESNFKFRPDYQRAARFIYLNRTCFNWMYRVNWKWYFNVPFWKYSNPKICDEEGLIKTREALENTTILTQPFKEVEKLAKKWDFVYFDPPYDTLSTTANFTDYIQWWFGKDMQEELANTFKKLDEIWCFVMLSNHNTPFIQELYKGFRQEIVAAKRMINSDATKRWEIEEIVVLNY